MSFRADRSGTQARFYLGGISLSGANMCRISAEQIHMQGESNEGIEVDVETLYVESESDPERNRFVFAYTVTIRNVGSAPARLLTRHWVIRDGNGKVQEVQGDGVVGEQPHLKPGEGFQYTSGTMLETSMGTMGGSYTMVTDAGEEFLAPIEDFLLSAPRTLH